RRDAQPAARERPARLVRSADRAGARHPINRPCGTTEGRSTSNRGGREMRSRQDRPAAAPRGPRRAAPFPLPALLAAGAAAPAGAWSWKEAAQPYAGKRITILDETTPLQDAMKSLVGKFEAETGIKVTYELLSHPEVISKGQADMLSGRGEYDAVMLH